MIELLRTWILGLAGAAVFCAVMTELCPKGAVKNVVKMLCGMLMAIALITPLLDPDMGSYSLNMSKYRQKGEEIVSGGKDLAQSYSRTIIEEECRAYILDKAAAVGHELHDVSVELKWSSEGFWYPTGCVLDGLYSEKLSGVIASELGISRENQKWSGDDEAA